MLKSILLKSFLLALSVNLMAQSAFQPGFIIKNSGDTIHGWVDSRSEIRNMQVCTFKERPDAEAEVFLPGEIAGYRFSESGKFYVSRYLETGHINDTVFVEFLLQGMSNLYYYNSLGYKAYFIESVDGGLYELRSDEVEIVRDGRTYRMSDERFKGVLLSVWSDQPVLRNEIENVRLGHRPLINLTRRYHDYVCDDEECIVFERSIPKVKVTFRPYIGYHLSHVTFKSITRFENIKFNPSMHPSFGVDMDFNLPRLNDKFSLVTGVMFSEEYYYGDYSYTMRSGPMYHYFCHIVNTNLNTRIGLKYTYPSKKIRPSLMAGFNRTFILSTDNDFTVDQIVKGIVTSSTIQIKTFDNNINGFFVTAGVDYEIGKVLAFSNVLFHYFSKYPFGLDVNRIEVSALGISTGVNF